MKAAVLPHLARVFIPCQFFHILSKYLIDRATKTGGRKIVCFLNENLKCVVSICIHLCHGKNNLPVKQVVFQQYEGIIDFK